MSEYENIIERSENASFYFRELVVNSETVQSDISILLKAEAVERRMEEFNHYLKKIFTQTPHN